MELGKTDFVQDMFTAFFDPRISDSKPNVSKKWQDPGRCHKFGARDGLESLEKLNGRPLLIIIGGFFKFMEGPWRQYEPHGDKGAHEAS